MSCLDCDAGQTAPNQLMNRRSLSLQVDKVYNLGLSARQTPSPIESSDNLDPKTETSECKDL
jgi:hypothetical protein